MADGSIVSSLRIGELAERASCAVETIRYYERIGLLSKAQRSGANHRLYSISHVEQLCFIRRCRSLDMSLEEIATLLSLRERGDGHCQQIEQVIGDHLSHVEARIAELTTLRDQLSELRDCCGGEQEGEACAILAQLEQRGSVQRSPAAVHSGTRHVDGAH